MIVKLHYKPNSFTMKKCSHYDKFYDANMIDEKCLTRLFLNVGRGNFHSNCRLCLHRLNYNKKTKTLEKLDEPTSFSNKKNVLTFGEVLGTVLGHEFSVKIWGILSACLACAQKTMECMQFIEDYKRMTKMLHNKLILLTESLNSVESVSENQKLYVVLGDKQVELMLLDKHDSKPEFSDLPVSAESNEVNLNKIVSNIVNGHQYIHCRLCLKEIQDNAVYFEDYVSFYKKNLLTLGHILIILLGDTVSEKIIGLDAICSACFDRTMKCMIFVDKCRRLNILLNRILDNMAVLLKSDIEPKVKNQSLCIILEEERSKLVLVKEKEKKKTKKKKKTFVEFDSTDEEDITDDELAGILSKKQKLKVKIRGGGVIQCPQCSRTKYCHSEERLREHIANVHTRHVCQECGVSRQGLESLRKHEQNHKANKRCSKCNRFYFSMACYDKHVAKCRVGTYVPFSVPRPKNTAKSGNNDGSIVLRANKKTEPAEIKLFKCKLCGLKIGSLSNLRQHERMHTGHSRIVSCSKCPKSFATKKAYLLHERTDHPEDKPYACEICQERFKTKNKRSQHLRFAHTIPKIACDICLYKFHTEKFMLYHRRKHYEPTCNLYVGKNNYPLTVSDLIRFPTGRPLKNMQDEVNKRSFASRKK